MLLHSYMDRSQTSAPVVHRARGVLLHKISNRIAANLFDDQIRTVPGASFQAEVCLSRIAYEARLAFTAYSA